MTAIQHQQAGNLDAAEVIYRGILHAHPDTPDALHLLGILMHQRGQNDHAAELIKKAITLNRADASYHYNLGEVYRSADHFESAVAAYRKAISLQPGVPDIHHNLGNALMELGCTRAAAGSFRRALKLAPDDPEIHNNLGNALAEQGRLEAAVRHYHEALHYHPNYADAYVNLGNIFKDQGNFQEAVTHYRRALSIQPDLAQAHYNLGVVLEERDRTDEAIVCYQKAIALDPKLTQAHTNLGGLLKEQGRLNETLVHYRQAMVLRRESATAAYNMGNVLQKLGRIDQAVACLQKAVDLKGDYAEALSQLGHCLTRLGKCEQAMKRFRTALNVRPRFAEVYFNMGVCLQMQGRFDEAIRCHRKALAIRPDLGEAYLHLSMNQGFKASDGDIMRMTRLLDQHDLSPDTRVSLHFALAKIYDHCNRVHEAFQQYRSANELKVKHLPFNPAGYVAYVNRLIATFDTEFFSKREDFGVASELPIFIVGMPRSGSSLIEQIIASHPQACGAGELDDIRATTRTLPDTLGTSTPFPECTSLLDEGMVTRLAGDYLGRLHRHSNDAVRISDKMLGNFLRLGLIALLFPKARVIHCRRDPLDTCLSCYFQHFEHGLRFTYKLEHLGVAYREYEKLMAHWHMVLPLPILDVHYEQLVADQEQQSRRLIEFCGLEWESRCLSFHKQNRQVRTASFWQVRQPLYASSIGRWRAYEKYLAPLVETLGR